MMRVNIKRCSRKVPKLTVGERSASSELVQHNYRDKDPVDTWKAALKATETWKIYPVIQALSTAARNCICGRKRRSNLQQQGGI